MHYTQQIKDICINKVLVQKIKIVDVAKFIGAHRQAVQDWIKIAKGLKIRIINTLHYQSHLHPQILY